MTPDQIVSDQIFQSGQGAAAGQTYRVFHHRRLSGTSLAKNTAIPDKDALDHQCLQLARFIVRSTQGSLSAAAPRWPGEARTNPVLLSAGLAGRGRENLSGKLRRGLLYSRGAQMQIKFCPCNTFYQRTSEWVMFMVTCSSRPRAGLIGKPN
jgi:hypothetical protein